MFNKLVAIEPVHLLDYAEKEIYKYAKEVILYDDMPKNDDEIIERIADADAVLVSFTTKIPGEVIRKAPNIKYIGMCCSLYSEQSANVDIVTARKMNIIVKGVRDYGDEGVLEFVISELVQLFHGYNGRMWEDYPREITNLKVGIIGLGTVGQLLARGLQFFGADVSYFSRTRKPDAEAKNIQYRELNDLLRENEVICTCVNKNIVLLHAEQFTALGNRKILINVGGTPTFDMEPFKKFLEGDNFFLCDMISCLSNDALLTHRNVRCVGRSSGLTKQAKGRLTKKVLKNIEEAMLESTG